MKKEFVLPQDKVTAGSKIVSDAKDVSETSAPQAFGVKSVQELKRFLQLDVFSETHERNAEDVLRKSGLLSRLWGNNYRASLCVLDWYEMKSVVMMYELLMSAWFKGKLML